MWILLAQVLTHYIIVTGKSHEKLSCCVCFVLLLFFFSVALDPILELAL